MELAGSIAAVSTGATPPTARRWISSAPFDTTLLLAGPILGLLTLQTASHISRGALLITALAYLVGIPHYLSTFVFFLGDDQRAHYLSRPLAFLGLPLILFASVAALRLGGWYEIVLIVIYLWNIWHVAMQSAGIASIYRHMHGGAPGEKRPAHLLIFSSNAAMALWFADGFDPLQRTVGLIAPHAFRYLAIFFGVCAVVALIVVAKQWSHRRVGGPEWIALASGILLFHPFLWTDLERATFGMLIGHFTQYLALVWLIQRRKYGEVADGSIAQRTVGRISANAPLTLAAFVATGVTVFLISKMFDRLGGHQLFIVVLNSLALIHFYLDGLIWAFRSPFVRQSLGPYLTAPLRKAA